MLLIFIVNMLALFLWKTKKELELLVHFKKILDESGCKPNKKILDESGCKPNKSEFYSKSIESYLK